MNENSRPSVEDYRAQLHAELTAVVQEEIGFNEMFATQIADALLRGLSKRLGGQDIYLPGPDKTSRDAQIRQEFNGRNLDEICRKYNLSERRIYQIVERKS